MSWWLKLGGELIKVAAVAMQNGKAIENVVKQVTGGQNNNFNDFNNKEGFVYFIQSEVGGDIKIGYAKDVERRLKELQTGHPKRLVVLGSMPGNFSTENDIHKMFAGHRVREDGEWFKDCYEIRQFIQRNCGGGFLNGILNKFSEDDKMNLHNNNFGDNKNCSTCRFGGETKFVKEENVWCIFHGKSVAKTFRCNKHDLKGEM